MLGADTNITDPNAATNVAGAAVPLLAVRQAR